MYDYMTYADIERLTGVRVPTLRKWRERGDLPAPDYLPFGGGRGKTSLWNRKTIEAWWEERREKV